MLVHLVYALMNLKDIHNFQRFQHSKRRIERATIKNTLQERMKSRIIKTLQSTINTEEESNNIIGKCMYVLLNAALKSIEISHYSCAGFIIKYLVSNFPSNILNSSYRQLLVNSGVDSKLDEHELGLSLGVRSFNINNTTAQYCLEKLTILLYGQQKFIKEKNVTVNHIPTEYIAINNIKLGNIKYLFTKFESSKTKYGLVYLQDNSFMEKLEKELTWKMKYTPNTEMF